MTPLPKIGILLPSKNDAGFIGSTLVALIEEIRAYVALGGQVELCCINDGSTDDTGAVMERHLYSCRAPYQFINRTENWGVTRSLEQGFNALPKDCDAILRCDADACFFCQGWLHAMVSFLFSDDRIGVVSPIIIKPQGYIDNFGIRFFPDGETPLELGHHYRPEAHGEIHEVDTSYGVYSLMRTADWTMDTGYFLWVEDEDQGLVLRQRGKKNFIMGNLPVVHFQDYRKGRTDVPKDTVEDFRVAHPIRRESLAYFEKKWGFSPLTPDLDIVRQRYAGTELLWFENEASQQAGREIIERFKTTYYSTDTKSPAITFSNWISRNFETLNQQRDSLQQKTIELESNLQTANSERGELQAKSDALEKALKESLINNQKLTLTIDRLKQKLEPRAH